MTNNLIFPSPDSVTKSVWNVHHQWTGIPDLHF